MGCKYKTRNVFGTTIKRDFEKRYGKVIDFDRISKKKFKVTYVPKQKNKSKKRR